MRPVSSWGRLSADLHDVVVLEKADAARRIANSRGPGIAYGMGRSYGDVCLNPEGVLWQTTSMDRFVRFDPGTGRMTCDAGVLLGDIQRVALAHGWMLPVTPGTQFATVGGAIANDVHGKNHHRLGTFGHHVLNISLLRTSGERIECAPDRQADWFAATIGGLGLTGIILQAEIQLRRVSGPWLEAEIVPFADLNEFFALADGAESRWEYTVSWIDCLAKQGRGLFMQANHSGIDAAVQPRGRPHAVPFVPPVSLVNRLTLKAFNTAYYNVKRRRRGPSVEHYEPFFYPLDNLKDWNRIYGPRGFFQYQSVVPRATGRDATEAMLREIARAGQGSFLAVLKTFGDRPSIGMMSFPRPGVTLALDFPNGGGATHVLFERLDAIVREAGGCIYPAKDARMPRSMFEAGFPGLSRFLDYWDPGVSSQLSRRLMGR